MNWFEPSRDHARTCREAMDRALWDSVPELLDEHGVAAADAIDQDISGPTDFLDYAAYFDLAIPLPEGAVLPESERAFALRRLARRLPVAANLEARPAMPRITRFVPAAYAPEELAQMARWWDHEPANRMAMTDPSDEEFATVSAAISEAMQYLAMASSELHGEVELLIRDIVLTRPDGVNNRINYSGASSFALWGALTINAETQREWLQVYRQIVHETAHNLLFAIARDGPLIAADPAERRASPLREDDRPLDGIFHAAFVSAREALSFDLLLQRHEREPCLERDDPEILEDLLEISVLAFADCIATLRSDDVSLTEFGDKILADCEGYMAGAFAIEAY